MLLLERPEERQEEGHGHADDDLQRKADADVVHERVVPGLHTSAFISNLRLPPAFPSLL